MDVGGQLCPLSFSADGQILNPLLESSKHVVLGMMKSQPFPEIPSETESVVALRPHLPIICSSLLAPLFNLVRCTKVRVKNLELREQLALLCDAGLCLRHARIVLMQLRIKKRIVALRRSHDLRKNVIIAFRLLEALLYGVPLGAQRLKINDAIAQHLRTVLAHTAVTGVDNTAAVVNQQGSRWSLLRYPRFPFDSWPVFRPHVGQERFNVASGCQHRVCSLAHLRIAAYGRHEALCHVLVYITDFFPLADALSVRNAQTFGHIVFGSVHFIKT